MNSSIVWLHEDALNDSLLSHGPALFVFDDEYLRAESYSLKRIAFLYESLLELPVEIHRGSTIECLLAFAHRHQAAEIVTSLSPNPWIQSRIEELRPAISVRVFEPEPFVHLPSPPDLKRFSRYWTRVESRLPIGTK